MNAGTQDLLLLTASFLLILGGVAYWLYSNIEAQQRKLGVLENVLYELRFAIQERKVTDEEAHKVHLRDSPPEIDMADYHQTETEEGELKEAESEKTIGIQRYVEPPESVAGEIEHTMRDFDTELPSAGDDEEDNLRPGGVLDLNEDEILNGWNKSKPTEESQFKKLFVGNVGETPAAGSLLESMPTKQLRELATERGLRVTKSMKKSELLEVLRSSATQNVVRRLEEAE
jgi:Rho termination factor, N-terminal domain